MMMPVADEISTLHRLLNEGEADAKRKCVNVLVNVSRITRPTAVRRIEKGEVYFKHDEAEAWEAYAEFAFFRDAASAAQTGDYSLRVYLAEMCNRSEPEADEAEKILAMKRRVNTLSKRFITKLREAKHETEPIPLRSSHSYYTVTDHCPYKIVEERLPKGPEGSLFIDYAKTDAFEYANRVKEWTGTIIVLSGGGGNTARLGILHAIEPVPSRLAGWDGKTWNLRAVIEVYEPDAHGRRVVTPYLGSYKIRQLRLDDSPVRWRDFEEMRKANAI